MSRNRELKNMSEYLRSLEPNDIQCYYKKFTLTTGECLLDPYTLVGEEWEEKYQQVSRYYQARCHRISYRNAKFLQKGINESI